ncbi:MAG: 2-oxoglutarate ferredoxin oxidoreductase subunit alpha, partial [Catenulispora sp.]
CSPTDCFQMAFEAVRIATRFMTPVFLLSDGYLANGAEPWRIPNAADLPKFEITHPGPVASNGNGNGHVGENGAGNGTFLPYKRDERLVRPWAIPGTAGLEHRIGGIEKQDGTGNISYDPANHDLMVRTRAAKVAGIDVPDLEVDTGSEAEAGSGRPRVLVLGWGSTYGPIQAACRRVRRDGHAVAHAHLRHLNPFPANLERILKEYDRVLIPEMNLGQLSMLVRARYLVDAVGYNQVRGLPFKAAELAGVIMNLIGTDAVEGVGV